MELSKILVADDDPAVVDLIEEALAENYSIIKTDNGYSVITKAKTEHPSLIILDLMLPRLDGYQTCKRLKEDKETANIPIIIISGKMSKEILLKLVALGIKDYFAKPFDIEELVKKVNFMTGKKPVQPVATNLKISLNSLQNILTVSLSGEFEGSDLTSLINTVKNKITSDIKKVVFNVSGLKIFGSEHIEYFKKIREYFKEYYGIEIRISTGDTKNLRANLIKNSEISEMLSIY